MRKMWWIGGVVLLVVVGGGWWLYSSLDRIVASAIRSYGSEITQVAVTLDSARIQPTEGKAALYGLALGNPEGFATPRALSVGEISMTLDVSTLTQDVVRIQELTIAQPEITYELASGGSNLEVLQRQVEAYGAAHAGAGSAADSQQPKKKVVIDHLYIKGATAQVSAAVLQGKAVSVPVPDVHLTDIGKKSGGATMGEAARQVVGALAQAVKRSAASLKLGGVVDSVKDGAAALGESVKGLFK